MADVPTAPSECPEGVAGEVIEAPRHGNALAVVAGSVAPGFASPAGPGSIQCAPSTDGTPVGRPSSTVFVAPGGRLVDRDAVPARRLRGGKVCRGDTQLDTAAAAHA